MNIGDAVTYKPQKPYAPWVLTNCIGATGTIVKLNDEFSARVRLDRGGCITASLENLQTQDTLSTLAQQMADAAQRMRDEAANEAAGRQGMLGPKKSAGSVEGSPLFGSSQKTLF